MKRSVKTWIGTVLIVGLSVLSLSAFSESYHYDFDDLKEDNWELWDNNSVWQVKDGFLRATIQPNDIITNAGLFQFKGIPGNYKTFEFFIEDSLIQRQEKKPGDESFTITVKDLGSKSAGFGVAIGRRFPEVDETYTFFYVFHTYGIVARTYEWFDAELWWEKEPRHPDVLQRDIRELESMQIRFNKGHFQWYADDEKLAEFEDPDFSSIEIIGFLLQSNGIQIGSGWVDSFTISGSGLPVSPQAKLATTWGQLKQLKK